MAGYTGRDFCKQLEEVLKKCDNLSQEIKDIKLNHSQEIADLKEKHKKEIKVLNERISTLEKENNELRKENTKLTNEVDRLKKQINNNSDNSSKPPSSDIKKNIPNNREKSDKKVGGQKGHQAHFLSKKTVEEKIKNMEFKHEVIDVGKKNKEYISKYILDLQINVIAKKYRFYKDEKGKYNVPKEFRNDVQYGNEIKTICAILNTEGIVALDRLTNFVSCISHGAINISKASILKFMEELSTKSAYLINDIENAIMNSELMNTDATTGRCENKNICVRTYSTNTATLLKATYGKGKKYIEETNILNRYVGTLVHDHETVMYNYGNRHVECNVHISRYLRGCFENTKNKWALKMRNFLCSLNEYRKMLKAKGVTNIEVDKLNKYSKRYDELIEEGYLENAKIKSKYLKQDEKKLLNRLKKYKENHLMFLYDFSVPFDNNLAERDLRHVKTKQKISGRFNNIDSMQIYLNIKSIIGTMKKIGKDFYTSIYNLYANIPVSVC